MNRLFRMITLLCICMLFTGIQPAQAREIDPGLSGSNVGSQNYINNQRWTVPVRSYLTETAKGLMVFDGADDGYTAAYYNDDYVLQDTVSIAKELPLFGGFYAASDGNYYIVTGQENPNELNSVECYRITKYDADWNRIGSVSLSGCNTVTVFRGGTCRMTDAEGYLLVHTCHEMYADDEGLNHEANVTIQVKMDTMTITDSMTEVAYPGRGYVSHSFNQFLLADNNHMVTLDHGDSGPRSISLFRYDKEISSGRFRNSTGDYGTQIDMLKIGGKDGSNDTYAAAGGFGVSSTHYLAVGNSIDQTKAGQTRNIWVASLPKQGNESTVTWLTDYAEGSTAKVSNPQFADLGNDTFMVLWTDSENPDGSWTDNTTVSYARVDKEGKKIGAANSAEAQLSDCVPVVHGNKLVWYTHSDSYVTFYEIDLSSNELTTVQAKTEDWVETEDLILAETEVDICKGQTYLPEATLVPENASDDRVRFVIEDESILSYYGDGSVWGKEVGTTKLHFHTGSGIEKEMTVNVVPLSGFSIGGYPNPMDVGEEYQWTITAKNEEAQPYIRYGSNDPEIVTVSETGLIHAWKAGETKIWFSLGQNKYEYDITVTGIDVTGITVNPSSLTMKDGETKELS
ncbi:MAG: hypothetical protein IKD69_11405, partial [Solobacterium sp.]|nr:hypothetical protein [Solobacterium sp.]